MIHTEQKMGPWRNTSVPEVPVSHISETVEEGWSCGLITAEVALNNVNCGVRIQVQGRIRSTVRDGNLLTGGGCAVRGCASYIRYEVM